MEVAINRIIWIDNLKGLLLLLNCTSHIMLRPCIISAIVRPTASYYVPLFIFLSGYLCKPKVPHLSFCGGQISLLCKRFKTLIVPYFFFSIVALLNGLVVGEELNDMLWQMLYEGRSCHAATPMYFVALLFMVSMTFTWITWNQLLSKIGSLIVVIMALMTLWFYIKDLPVELPWYLNDLPFYGSFFLSGFMIRRIANRYQLLPMSFSIRAFSAILAVILMIIGVWGLINPIKGTFMALVCPVCLVSCVILLIHSFVKVNKLLNIPHKFLVFMAVNGIAVLGAHNFINGYFHFCLKQFDVVLNEWVSFIATFVIIYGTLYYFLVPFMNRYLYKVLGK